MQVAKLFSAGGVHDSKELVKCLQRAHAEAPLMCLWVSRWTTSTSHPQNFLH